MSVYYTSLVAAILFGIGGQIALKSAAKFHQRSLRNFSIRLRWLAHVLWNEPLGWPQLAGIVLIGIGASLSISTEAWLRRKNRESRR